jgi:hypothetical protein
VLSLGFLLLISMLVATVLAAGGKYLGSYLPALQVVSFVVSFARISLLFVHDVQMASRCKGGLA